MLKRFYVDNFKTLVNLTYDLAPVNLLIGTNNSGKTNLCQALRFVSLTSGVSLADAAKGAAHEEFNLPNVSTGRDVMTFEVEAILPVDDTLHHFRYRLEVSAASPLSASLASRRLRVESETLMATPGNGAVIIENDKGNVVLRHEGNAETAVTTATVPTDATMLSRLFETPEYHRANVFKRYLSSWLYYDLEASALRQPQATSLQSVLTSDGGNLASVLYNLKNTQERLYRSLMATTQAAIEPELELLNFVSPTENLVFMLPEDKGGHRYTPFSLSNGTLRFLALAYVILWQGALAKSQPGTAPPVILVEEPETGIFAGHLKHLADLVDSSGRSGQYLVTSQSPYFIDLFDTLLEGITLVSRSQGITQLRKPDIDALKGLLERYPLGELHFRGMLP